MGRRASAVASQRTRDQRPRVVTADKVETVVTAGDAKATDICTTNVAAMCKKYGVS